MPYLWRVTFSQCDVGVSTVTDLSLLENLFNLRHRQVEQFSIMKLNFQTIQPACLQNSICHCLSKKYKKKSSGKSYIKLLLAMIHRCCGFHYYLDDQVDIWGWVGDGEDGRSGQGGMIHIWSVRFQEVFILFWVQIAVEVLRYLEGDKQRWV